nr:adenylyl-sulfate kinase [Saccharothrix sp. ST-888]
MRERHAANGTDVLAIHVATQVEACSERDVKGIYVKQADGDISGVTVAEAPYAAPREG